MALLCATNFSPEANAATAVAAELARLRGEDLWLAFVVPSHTANAFGEAVLATADERLKAEAARIRKPGSVVTPVLLIGKLQTELPKFVTENGISLVIAGDASTPPGGSGGTGALGRLGRALPVPLWAIRKPDAILAWARGERALKVVVGLDHTRSTAIAARWVETLARFGKLELTGGHVFFPAAEAHRLGLPLPKHWDDAHPDLLAALQRELDAKLPASLPHRVVLELAIGRVSDHLAALAERAQADVLVLGTHHRVAIGRLWSVSEQCLTHAPMSVVCVPATAEEAATEPKVADVARVLIATDFSKTGDHAIAWGLGAVAPGGSVDVVHVSGEPLTAEAERRVVDQLRARVPGEARARGLSVNVHALVGPTPAHAILAAAERFDSSVVCLGTRSRTVAKALFGSTAKAVLEASRRPVLVVPPVEP